MQVIINYSNGCMTINLDNFFPTTQKNVKKLLQTINMDWKHGEENIKTIRAWMTQEIQLCDKNLKRKEKLQKNLKVLP